MSMFRITNKTNMDLTLEIDHPLNVIPANTTVDLIDGLGMQIFELIGVLGGRYFEGLKKAINSNNFALHDGDAEIPKSEAIFLLKQGQFQFMNPQKRYFSQAYKGFSFESHNFLDKKDWGNCYCVTPLRPFLVAGTTTAKMKVQVFPGYAMLLTKSKIMMTRQLSFDGEFLFQVGSNNPANVRSDSYPSIDRLKLGSDKMYTSPQMGTIQGRSSQEMVHIHYMYEEPFYLLGSLGETLTLDVKLKEGLNMDDMVQYLGAAGEVIKFRIEGKLIPEHLVE